MREMEWRVGRGGGVYAVLPLPVENERCIVHVKKHSFQTAGVINRYLKPLQRTCVVIYLFFSLFLF